MADSPEQLYKQVLSYLVEGPDVEWYHIPNSKGVASHQGPWLKRGSGDATEGSKVECCQLARNGYISLDQFRLSFIYHRLTLQLQLCSLGRLSLSIVLPSSQISVCHLPLPPASI
nr:hypothetical protein Iba_chr05aCG13870 [Ipomoea batatas]